MKFDMANRPEELLEEPSIIGNVYRCKGGNKTKYWVVVAIRVNTVICLGVDEDGEITSSSNYGLHVFADYPWSRKPIGRVIDMPTLNFSIEWDRLQ